MNTLENMIRSATQATADEIDPASLPSPRLPFDTRLARTGRANGSTRHLAIRRWATPLAAATAVIAVATVSAVVVSGGSGKAPAAHRRGPVPAASSAAGQLSASQIARLDNEVVGSFFPATGAQYAVGAQLYGTIQALGYEGTARCLSRLGFTTHVVVPSVAFLASTNTSMQWPDLGRMSRTGLLTPDSNWPGQPGSRRFQAKYTQCMNAARAFSTPIYNDGLRLESLWLPSAEMTKIQNSPQERAALPGLESCAAAHGAPAGSVTSYATFTNWISGLSDGPGSRGATPAQLRRINRQLAPIFVRCAGPYIRVQDKLELAQQVIFLRRHQKQVQALEALTRRIIARQQRQDGLPVT